MYSKTSQWVWGLFVPHRVWGSFPPHGFVGIIFPFKCPPTGFGDHLSPRGLGIICPPNGFVGIICPSKCPPHGLGAICPPPHEVSENLSGR